MIIGLARTRGGEIILFLLNSISACFPHLLWILLNFFESTKEFFYVAKHMNDNSVISLRLILNKITKGKHSVHIRICVLYVFRKPYTQQRVLSKCNFIKFTLKLICIPSSCKIPACLDNDIPSKHSK